VIAANLTGVPSEDAQLIGVDALVKCVVDVQVCAFGQGVAG
jgi:hypothetical protein